MVPTILFNEAKSRPAQVLRNATHLTVVSSQQVEPTIDWEKNLAPESISPAAQRVLLPLAMAAGAVVSLLVMGGAV